LPGSCLVKQSIVQSIKTFGPSTRREDKKHLHRALLVWIDEAQQEHETESFVNTTDTSEATDSEESRLESQQIPYITKLLTDTLSQEDFPIFRMDWLRVLRALPGGDDVRPALQVQIEQTDSSVSSLFVLDSPWKGLCIDSFCFGCFGFCRRGKTKSSY
jgi:hypothetical protein